MIEYKLLEKATCIGCDKCLLPDSGAVGVRITIPGSVNLDAHLYYCGEKEECEKKADEVGKQLHASFEALQSFIKYYN